MAVLLLDGLVARSPKCRTVRLRGADRVAAAKGLTMAEVVRRAVDDYLDEEPDAELALSATFGSSPDADVPSRDDWQRG